MTGQKTSAEPMVYYSMRKGAMLPPPGQDRVRVDRATPFGNPYRAGPNCTRAQAIAWYEEYLRQRMEREPQFRRRVAGLYGKALGCWCHPLGCHSQVLAHYAEHFHRRGVDAELPEPAFRVEEP